MAMTFVQGRDVVIVLDEENVERIQHADPFELDMEKMGTYTLGFPLRIFVCYARKDDPRMKELIERKDVLGLRAYLARGFKVRPGDHNGRYTHVRTMEGEK